MLGAGLIVSRALHYAALLALFGGALFPFYAFASAEAPQAQRLIKSLRPLQVFSALIALASGLGWFAFTAAAMAGRLPGAVDPRVWLSVMQSTDFGALWLGRLALIVVVLIVVAVRPRPAPWSWIAPTLAALALASLAGTGHARTPDGWSGAVHALADVIHLVAAGVWLGGLWPLGVSVAWSTSDRSDEVAATREMLTRFSGVGYLAVASLVASGLANTWFLVRSIRLLTSTPYGLLLLLKIVFVVGMGMLAVANRFWITPRLTEPASPAIAERLHRLRSNVLAEQALGLVVVAIVAILGTLQPAIAS